MRDADIFFPPCSICRTNPIRYSLVIALQIIFHEVTFNGVHAWVRWLAS